jgi:hypothetical protein
MANDNGLVAPSNQLTPTPPAGSGNSQYNGWFQRGGQPAGNNYPAGIYGVGKDGSGTAIGTLTDNEYVSKNLNGLLNENGQYIQQARQQAVGQANSRGALNSSIAAGNAQGAAIQSALPIAAGDASNALSLQESNLNNLSKSETANIGANAEMSSAAAAAGASMYSADANNRGALLRQQDQLAFTGEQNQLNYQRSLGMSQQQYYENSALSAQGYQQNLGLDQFNLGASLLQGQQQFYSNAGIQAMNDPAIMGNPQAFGGYLQFLMNPFSQSIDNVFGNIFGNVGTPQGGHP